MSLVHVFSVAPEYVQLTVWAVVLFGIAGGVRRAVDTRAQIGVKQPVAAVSSRMTTRTSTRLEASPSTAQV